MQKDTQGIVILVIVSLVANVTLSFHLEILGWNDFKRSQGLRLVGADWKTMKTRNVQRCLRLCWLHSVCRGVSYKPTGAHCMLHKDWPEPAYMVKDTESMVVDLKEASPKKVSFLNQI